MAGCVLISLHLYVHIFTVCMVSRVRMLLLIFMCVLACVCMRVRLWSLPMRVRKLANLILLYFSQGPMYYHLTWEKLNKGDLEWKLDEIDAEQSVQLGWTAEEAERLNERKRVPKQKS